jgi:hypothetical protein
MDCHCHLSHATNTTFMMMNCDSHLPHTKNTTFTTMIANMTEDMQYDSLFDDIGKTTTSPANPMST